MKSLIIDLFGSYTPITYETIINDDLIDVIPPGAAGVDWEWIAGVALFGITLYAVLRIIGVVISRVSSN